MKRKKWGKWLLIAVGVLLVLSAGALIFCKRLHIEVETGD